ncbi:MAG: DNA mismatch repair endonuclease MutL [Christensenellaceae bacterium]|jgi:DNA mismatch repair protein MutL
MAKIRILDEEIYTRIAAGEVVVNPAAVVKELLENSIDAGATAVTVEISGGGVKYIRVTDNGSGIEKADMPFAIEKHATSKIRSLDDLEKIATLGFRGEALSSIAAVSMLNIASRVKESTEGYILETRGGKDVNISPAGLPEGTTVKVENLFFNIPARKKFLKSAAAETTALTNVVLHTMLARPDISFKLVNHDKVIYHTSGNGNTVDVIRVLYGNDTADRLREIKAAVGQVSISGYISDSSLTFRSGRNITVILNGRYVESKTIRQAVISGYGERLLKGFFPFAVLYIYLPVKQTDVNVHPSKLQVNMFDEQRVLEAVQHATKKALEPDIPPAVHIDEGFGRPHASNIWKEDARQRNVSQTPERLMGEQYKTLPYRNALHVETDINKGFQETIDTHVGEPVPEAGEQLQLEDVRRLVDYRIVGQVFKTYILVEYDETLYIIDQHAAHERITYERLKAQAKSGQVASQTLLSPFVMKHTPEDFESLQKHKDLLFSLGFEYEEFGACTLRYGALPVAVEKSGAMKLIEEILATVEKRSDDIVLLQDTIIKSACKHSVRAGYELSERHIAALMTEISELDAIPHCPHGRPIAVALGKKELEKGFKRRI